MDPLLRGVCEQYIDMKLEDSEIEKVSKLVDTFDLPTASKEDVSLGIFIGSIYSQLNTHHLKMYNKLPKKEDIEIYHQILQRRAGEIKAKFNVAPAQKEVLIPEAEKDAITDPKENLEDYYLVLRKKAEEIKAEIEKRKDTQVDDGQGVDPDDTPAGEFKFRFDMSTRKEPVRKIFGIPTKRKETVAPTAK